MLAAAAAAAAAAAVGQDSRWLGCSLEHWQQYGWPHVWRACGGVLVLPAVVSAGCQFAPKQLFFFVRGRQLLLQLLKTIACLSAPGEGSGPGLCDPPQVQYCMYVQLLVSATWARLPARSETTRQAVECRVPPRCGLSPSGHEVASPLSCWALSRLGPGRFCCIATFFACIPEAGGAVSRSCYRGITVCIGKYVVVCLVVCGLAHCEAELGGHEAGVIWQQCARSSTWWVLLCETALGPSV
jgi:hypothetical protein